MPSLNGITTQEEELRGCHVTTLDVQTEDAAASLGKAVGSYITIDTAALSDEHEQIECAGECLAEILVRVLGPHFHGKLCVCGLGNRELPADSLGPEVTSRLPLNLFQLAQGYDCRFREVCSFTPGVFGINNVRPDTLVAGAVQAMGADCLLLVDSLVTLEPAKLFKSIQISTAGGTKSFFSDKVGNWTSLGIPVISLGVPTAIPMKSLCPSELQDDKLFTSTMAASEVSALGIILSYALIRVCWPSITRDECFLLTKISKDPLPYGSLCPLDGADSSAEDRQKLITDTARSFPAGIPSEQLDSFIKSKGDQKTCPKTNRRFAGGKEKNLTEALSQWKNPSK